ncbi:hypothetical protein MBLNU457_7621t1 [Dothideomycetes sp. NU457]
MATNVPVNGATPITIKISIGDSIKKLKLPLSDLVPEILFDKLRGLLPIPYDKEVIFERFSDSHGGFVLLQPDDVAVFKTLLRAAKAKLKLRLRATIKQEQDEQAAGMSKTATLAAQLPEVPKGPVIARSPALPTVSRMSTALDLNSVGPGIFDFTEARNKQQNSASSERPAAPSIKLPIHPKSMPAAVAALPIWSIYCNECDTVMEDEHFHCSICDGGDFDLCTKCVAGGKLCHSDGHWLVKRFVKDGSVQSSTTERLPPRQKGQPVVAPKPASNAASDAASDAASIKSEARLNMPGAFSNEANTLAENSMSADRTCNQCIDALPEDEFVTCTSCDDFDLCLTCHAQNKHGHHPGHAFVLVVESPKLTLVQQSLLPAGRNVRHHAICDGCNKNIYGIRHKCFVCPDFDYCSDCLRSKAAREHHGHRFAAIYESIPGPFASQVQHTGIFCDGECAKQPEHLQRPIVGDRYKCVVCHDTDFCANCEANPNNKHNATHPLVKIKRPIKGLNISTMNETGQGKVVSGLGDRQQNVAKAAVPVVANAPAAIPSSPAQPSSVSLRTVANIDPYTPQMPLSASRSGPPIAADQLIGMNGARHLASRRSQEKTPAQELTGNFIRDTIPDGSFYAPGTRFTQVWTIKNPGPLTWPAGCSVRFIGGDNMLNLDECLPSTASAVAEANESNVIGREVKPGEEAAFKVLMKAPSRVGRAISYWRLKTPEGIAFGHRLWCDVIVTPSADEIRDFNLAQKTSTATPAVTMADAQAAPYPDVPSAMPAMQTNCMPPQAPNYYSSYLERMKAMRATQLASANSYVAEQKARKVADEARMPTSRVQLENSERMRLAQEMLRARGQEPSQQAIRLKAFQLARREADAVLKTGRENMWLKQMEDFMARTSASASSPSQAPVQAPAQAQEVKPEATSAAIPSSVEKSPEASSTAGVADPSFPKTEGMRESQMIFPTLEKESPASSIHSAEKLPEVKAKAAYVEDEETGKVTAAASTHEQPSSDASSTTTPEGFEDLASEIEVLSADGEMSEDDGFLTDEEYDILDASDQETVADAA